MHADAADFLRGHDAPGPCVVYLNPCLDIRTTDSEDLFLHQLARLEPISTICLHAAIEAATRRVVLRVPHGVDPMAASHGLAPTRIVSSKHAQSGFLVFDK